MIILKFDYILLVIAWMPSYIIQYQILTLNLYNNSEKWLDNLLFIKFSEGPTVHRLFKVTGGQNKHLAITPIVDVEAKVEISILILPLPKK